MPLAHTSVYSNTIAVGKLLYDLESDAFACTTAIADDMLSTTCAG